MILSLSPHCVEAMVAAARAALPHEACGLLLGSGHVIEDAVPAANVATQPSHHFEIDPAALIAAHRAARQGGPQVLGYFHSHPNGLARPSATDVASAARDGRVWIILALSGKDRWSTTCWRDGPDGFEALSYRIAQG